MQTNGETAFARGEARPLHSDTPKLVEAHASDAVRTVGLEPARRELNPLTTRCSARVTQETSHTSSPCATTEEIGRRRTEMQ